MNDLRIKTCVLGQVGTNCYLVYDEQTKEAVVIDPADNCGYIMEQCKKLGITPRFILLTHGHFDHILAAEELAKMYSCKIYAGKDENDLLLDPAANLTGSWGMPPLSLKADVLVGDREELQMLGLKWEVLFTPGHTAGSVCYYLEQEGVLFSGDTLFAESLGRTDLPTGDGSVIIKSILERLLVLPDDTMVYPGHGDPTVIGHEKQYNPVAVYHRK
ncbi:MAG: MBL fold metallo-hydrolase [Lachnospiraceae bacterium]